MGALIERPGTGPGWTSYLPERSPDELARALAEVHADCRGLVNLAEEAHLESWHTRLDLTWDEFCARHLKRPASEIAAMVAGLRLMGHAMPVPAEVALATGQRVIAAANAPTTGQVLPEGRPKKLDESASLPRSKRARAVGLSLDTQKKLDRLARCAPEFLARVQQGELSVHRACLEAGVVKRPDGLKRLLRAWAAATELERQDFLNWIEGPCDGR
jgi:hypothetical protein